MKKFLAFLLTVFYIGFSSGMVYNVHYCLNEIFISAASSDTCNLCGTEKKKDCCKDEVKVLKTDVAQKADISSIGHAPLQALLPSLSYVEFLIPVSERTKFSVYSHAPPDRSELPLFISYCNFRI